MVPRPARILIADDSDDLRRALRNILETRSKFTICGKATNGIEAVTQAKELNPDLIILDLQMPDMNGLEAAKQILQLSPSMPILIFSMYLSRQLLQEAHRLGVRGCLHKGAGFETIIEGVEAVLRGELFFPAETEI